MQLEETIRDWNKEECVRFAVWCAKRVANLSSDPRVAVAIAMAERWLDDLTDIKLSIASDASDAAYAALDAAYAAHATFSYASRDAAYAAAAAACAAAHDVRDAAYAARAAVYATVYAANKSGVTDHDMLQMYIGEMLIDAANSR